VKQENWNQLLQILRKEFKLNLSSTATNLLKGEIKEIEKVVSFENLPIELKAEVITEQTIPPNNKEAVIILFENPYKNIKVEKGAEGFLKIFGNIAVVIEKDNPENITATLLSDENADKIRNIPLQQISQKKSHKKLLS